MLAQRKTTPIRNRAGRLIRSKELAGILGCSQVSLWRWRKEGRIPQPVRLSPRFLGWPESVVEGILRGEYGELDEQE